MTNCEGIRVVAGTVAVSDECVTVTGSNEYCLHGSVETLGT